MDHYHDDTESSTSKQVSKTKPFTIFCQLNLSKYRQKYPKCTTAQINNILAQEWARTSFKKRRQYIDIAAQYEQDLAVQRASNRAKGGKQSMNSGLLSQNYGAISANIHQQSSNTNISSSNYMNSTISSGLKGKGKQKRSNFIINSGGINVNINGNQRSKNDADGDYIPQNSPRSAIPAPILDDGNGAIAINEIDPIQQQEESIKLANFSEFCLSVTNPTCSFDCSWYIDQPVIKSNL